MLDINLKPVSFSKKIKESVKGAVKYINAFEDTVSAAAIRKGADSVICGHIHKPEIRKITIDGQSVNYLNSGDWVENLSSLEFNNGQWRIFNYRKDFVEQSDDVDADFEKIVDTEVKELFNNMLADFQR
jgi:UDP-2,3-diacylglucosamine pyrophosphatase LpxH